MVGHLDGITRKKLGTHKIAHMQSAAVAELQWQPQHLIEVAIVDIALPIDTEEGTAHHTLEVFCTMVLVQQLHIPAKLPLGDQEAAKAQDRHVRQDIEAVEHDPIVVLKLPSVIRLEGCLRGRQGRALGIIDQIQDQAGVGLAVAQIVQPLKRADAFLEDAAAALPIDIVFEKKRQGGRDLDPLLRQKLGQRLLTRLPQDGQIAAIDHVNTEPVCLADEITEMGVQLRRTTGYIQGFNTGGLQKGNHLIHGLDNHLLGPRWPGVDMAMYARLVAAVAQVYLERLDLPAANRREVRRLK